MLKLEAKKEWTHHLSSEVIRRTGVLRQPDYNITSNYGNDNVGGVNNNSNMARVRRRTALCPEARVNHWSFYAWIPLSVKWQSRV